MIYKLSPSRIARYFYHECERYLRYSATPSKMRKRLARPIKAQLPTPATAAILQGGYDWEEIVITKHLPGIVHIANGHGALHECTHATSDSLKILANLVPGQAIYQPTLSVPKLFLQRYGLDPNLCLFPPCRPDLIQCVATAYGNRLRIIDIKASEALKTSHRIQVTLYALMLRDIVQQAGSDILVDMECGGIWLYEQRQPEWFDLALSVGAVEHFLREQLSKILTQPMAEVPWHLFFRCEWCEFYPHCRIEAARQQSVSLVPYLSVGGRRFLRAAQWQNGAAIQSLSDLQALLNDNDHVLAGCGSLRGKG